MQQFSIKRKTLIIYVVIILLIFLRYIFAWYNFNNIYVDDSKNKYYEITIIELSYKSNNKVEYMVKLNNDNFILNICNSNYTDKQIDISKYINYKYNDILKINGKIKIPEYYRNIGEFNYKKYLNSKNIYGYIMCYIENKEDIVLVKTNTKNTILKDIYNFKDYISKRLDENLGSMSPLTKSMIYGDQTNLSDEIKDNFKKLGISHILSVSGSNIATIILILDYMNIKINDLTKIKRNTLKYKTWKLKNYINSFIVLCIVLTFTLISSFELSIVRASIMVIISKISKLLSKNINIYNSLFISFLIILLIYPFAIFNIGLNLSFLATLGIVLFQNNIFCYLENLFKNMCKFLFKVIKVLYLKLFCYKSNNVNIKYENEGTYIKKNIFKFNILKKILKYILLSISITISAQILILPLQIETFNEISLNIFISNILVSIFDINIRLIGIVGIILSFLKPISDFLFKSIIPFAHTLETLVKFMAKDAKSITIISLNTLIYFEYYLIILTAYIYFYYKKRATDIKHIKKKRQQFIISIILFVISLSLFFCYKYNSNYITFFNVGQGDMSYIKYKKKSILIDCGSKSEKLSANILKSYFKNQNIKAIDLIIISHFHSDHINGIIDIIKDIKVDKIVCAYQESIKKENENIYKSYIEIKKYALSKNILFSELKTGNNILLDDINIKLLSPNLNEVFKVDSINASSLVCNININNKNYLFMGDATSDTENRILSYLKENTLKVEILKIGHHGSSSSTSNNFISKIKPVVGIITAQKKYYGHPSEKTIKTLNFNNVKIFKTETLGQIIFKIK